MHSWTNSIKKSTELNSTITDNTTEENKTNQENKVVQEKIISQANQEKSTSVSTKIDTKEELPRTSKRMDDSTQTETPQKTLSAKEKQQLFEEKDSLRTSISGQQITCRNIIQSVLLLLGSGFLGLFLDLHIITNTVYITTFNVAPTIVICIIFGYKLIPIYYFILWFLILIPCIAFIPIVSIITNILLYVYMLFIIYKLLQQLFDTAENLGKNKKLLQFKEGDI